MELMTIYDSNDAIIYIVVVILWYSSCILFLLRMQMIPSAGVVEHSSKHSANLFNRNFHNKNDNKAILEELADKEKRDKLWDIYFDRTNSKSNKMTRKEPFRIRNIQRRLATIDKVDQDYHETMQFLHGGGSLTEKAYLSVNRNKSSLGSHSSTRHHSLIDPEIIEEWKQNFDNFKLDEKYPRPLQRLIKRRKTIDNKDQYLSKES